MGEACSGSGAILTEQVLREEAYAIHSTCLGAKSGRDLNQALNQLGSSALCLSGGGVRSAAFALGVIQAFATHPRAGSDGPRPADDADKSMLAKFHYLSTVSGGGYLGSWLSAWLLAKPVREVWAGLVSRPEGSAKPPRPLAALYSLSSYLTPRTGIISPNTFAAAGLWMRNLILNWLVILPPIMALILLIKLIGIFSVWLIEWEDVRISELSKFPLTMLKLALELGSAAGAIVLLVLALVLTSRGRPSLKGHPGASLTKTGFLRGPLLCSILSAFLLVHFLGSDFVGALLLNCKPVPQPAEFPGLTICNQTADPISGWLTARHGLTFYIAVGTVLSAALYWLASLISHPGRRGRCEVVAWLLSGAVYGALVALGLYGYLVIPAGGINGIPTHFIHLSFGVPWILLAQTVGSIVFVGLTSRQQDAEADREWFGRGTSWFLLAGLTWLSVMFVIFFGDLLNWFTDGQKAADTIKGYIPFVAGASGVVTAFLGKSSMISATAQQRGFISYILSLILPIAAIIFVAALLTIVSYLADQIMFGESLIPDPHRAVLGPQVTSLAESTGLKWPAEEALVTSGRAPAAGIPWTYRLVELSASIVVLLIISFVTSRAIDINRFSLHSIYRNRLIRAFLGVSRKRDPDPFSDYDPADSPEMHRLWPPTGADGRRPFHVVNITHGAAPEGTRLAWQERRAASFTVSPLHCGGDILGFRTSTEYGAPSGITLGTAMAISGAAASPNMGYHSSPAITFLLTMFGVRMGWWLGNPGRFGNETYRTIGPTFAIKPLIQEALGAMTTENDYVFLSDGGHFDNLGLYEMVRRRCRFIVISDATWDPQVELDGLADSLRKIEVELGVIIRFKGLERFKPRPEKHSDTMLNAPYHAIGEIDYRSADGGGENGFILYIKAGYHGSEGAGIRGYANTHEEFPHEATVDQWVTRSQFESYRELGFEIADKILERALDHPAYAADPSVDHLFAALRGDSAATPA